MKIILTILVTVFLILTMMSCEVLGDIFSAGLYTGIFIVVIVVIIIFIIIGRPKKR